ncbi:hypothetical protein N7494_007868 [Penicillium frequentans]|uniref:Uncharacterized protein n=1 Tax=Penicillium frequentans TaxID=3151616 RepID=A0AAD6CVW7_9EURO|nr:hypothetical protein N7494_007868 [Penicillium glabrum]
MATRSRIPIEILTIINTFTADWIGLENLWQVFPQIKDLFTGDPNRKADPEAIRLVEAILKDNPIMSHELHRHFRMTMALRQPSLADTSLAVFMDQDYSLSSMSSSSITCHALQEMVIIAANIQRLACVCLATLLARLREIQPRRWEGELISDTNIIRVTGTAPYEPRDAGPPSWIEEYRVYRALWHRQLYFDLLVSVERLKWPLSDLEHLRSNDMDWIKLPPMAAEEVRSVRECLEGLSRTDRDHCTEPSVKSNSSDMTLLSNIPNFTQLLWKFDTWSPPFPPRFLNYRAPGIPNDIWGRGTEMTERNPMAARWRSWQRRSKTHPARHQTCSLQDSRPWRALGMPIWDLWRFYGLGLWEARWPLQPDPGPILTPNGVEIPKGGNPPIHGEDIGYRFSVFVEESVRIEFQEKMEKLAEDKSTRG